MVVSYKEDEDEQGEARYCNCGPISFRNTITCKQKEKQIMASLNKVVLIGNLTRDPDLRHTTSGATVSGFGLAINSKYKQGDEWKENVCFVDITVWGNLAENCSKYISKGSPVLIEGRLNFETWEKDGKKQNKLAVVATIVQFLGGKQPSGQEETPSPGHIKQPSGKVDLLEDEDLPF
jgi:single-strand DNA-binding protein